MRIFVSGSLAYDRIMSFPGKFSDHILPDKIHILNVCFLVNGMDERFGGTAGNIAYTMSLLGEKPTILATAGKDFDGYERWLKKHDLPMDGIKRIDDDFTAGAYITTDQSDNQITGFNPAAMNHQAPYDFAEVDPKDAIAVVSPGNLQDMRDFPAKYRELGIPYVFDPGQNIPAFSGEQLLEMITGSMALISNDYELELIMKATGETREQLLKRTGAIVTTLGEHGSVVVDESGETKVAPAKARQVKDPTGAGDSFRAGLLKGLVMGKSLAEAAKMGSVSSVYAVELLGTQEHSFTFEEYMTRYDENFGALK